MAKGNQAKIDVGTQIIDLFGNSAFWNGEGKEIRINTIENGEPVQIKIALTAAKVAIEPGAADEIPGAKINTKQVAQGSAPVFSNAGSEKIEATAEERDAVANLMTSLGL